MGVLTEFRQRWNKEKTPTGEKMHTPEEIDSMMANMERGWMDAKSEQLKEQLLTPDKEGKTKLKAMDKEEVESYVNTMLKPSRVGAPVRTSMGRADNNIFLSRKFRDDEYNEFEHLYRELLGEHKDPIVTVLRSVEKVGTYLAALDTQHRLLEMNDTFKWMTDLEGGRSKVRDIEVNGKKMKVDYNWQIPDTGEFGPLAGLWATDDFRVSLINYFGDGKEATESWAQQVPMVIKGIYGTYVAAAKLSKTVYSSYTHTRNVVGNVSISMTAGHFFRFGNMHEAFAATDQNMTKRGGQTWRGKIAGLVTKPVFGHEPDLERTRALVQDAINRGVMGDNAAVTEVNDIITASWGMSLTSYAKMSSPSQQLGLAPKLVKGAKGIVQKTHNLHMRWYQAEDDVWKMLGYLCEIDMLRKAHPEWSEDQIRDDAARRIRDTYPTGSNAPEAIKWIRWLPVGGTFPTWWWEFGKTQMITKPTQMFKDFGSGNAVLQRHATAQLVRYTLMGTLATWMKPMMEELLRTLSGWEPYDDDENKDNEKVGAPWNMGKDVSNLLTPDGEVKTIDWESWLPYLRINGLIHAWGEGDTTLESGLNAFKSGTDELFGEDMVGSAVARMFLNRTPDSFQGWVSGYGHPLVNPEDPKGWVKRLSYGARKTLEPGHLKSLRKLGVTNWFKQAFGMDTEEDDDGADTRIVELMKIFSGIGIMDQDTEKSSGFAIWRAHERITNMGGVVRSGLRDTSETPEDFGRLLDTMEYARRMRYEDLYAVARAMEKSGMDRPAVYRAFDVKFSKQVARMIVVNARVAGKPKYMPYELKRDSSAFKQAQTKNLKLAEKKWQVYLKHRAEMMKRASWNFDKWEEGN